MHIGGRLGAARRRRLSWTFGLTIASLAVGQTPPTLFHALASGQTRPKEQAGFVEARKGDVPEGSAGLITPEAVRGIESGLDWLARQQNADGSFGSGSYRGNIAVTSLAAIAFMGTGSSPGRGPFGPQIDKALVYVMDHTANSGFISVPGTLTAGPMYSHGWGTLFLAEAYGMSKRPELREKLQKAVQLIVNTQNDEGAGATNPCQQTPTSR